MLIKGAGKKENRLFVWMMLHKRQGVQDLFNYSLDFTSRNIQNFQLTFFVMERETLNYKKEYYPAALLACPYDVVAQKKCQTCSGYPALEYCTMFLVNGQDTL